MRIRGEPRGEKSSGYLRFKFQEQIAGAALRDLLHLCRVAADLLLSTSRPLSSQHYVVLLVYFLKATPWMV